MQVLLNLLSNGLKFTFKGYLKIKCIRKNELLECSVKDTGIGIKEEDIPQLFQQFGMLESSSPLNATGIYTYFIFSFISSFFNSLIHGKGTGLGLFLSKKICGLLGGKINVKSTYGKGSCFTFTLKFADPIKIVETTTLEVDLNPNSSRSFLLTEREILKPKPLLKMKSTNLELPVQNKLMLCPTQDKSVCDSVMDTILLTFLLEFNSSC